MFSNISDWNPTVLTSIGLILETSNPDTWRAKPSTSCQLLVDHSELCTNVIFNFSQLILEA